MNKKLFKNLSFGLIIIIAACSGRINSLYFSDYPLTTGKVSSQSGKFSVLLPKGWFIAEDNDLRINEIWLIKEDYSASISFIPINVDSSTADQLVLGGLQELKRLNIAFRKAKVGNASFSILNEEFFQVNDTEFFAYEYTTEDHAKIRVVLFKFNGKFYECSASSSNSQNSEELFNVQNTILATIQ